MKTKAAIALEQRACVSACASDALNRYPAWHLTQKGANRPSKRRGLVAATVAYVAANRALDITEESHGAGGLEKLPKATFTSPGNFSRRSTGRST